MRRFLTPLRRLLTREDGIALPVALSSLALISLLAAMTASGAVSLSDSSTQDRSSKRALAAAEAGLNVAAYRVNYYTDTNPPLSSANLAVLNNQCITTVPEYPVGGKCQSATGDLGNNARYTYYVTPNPPPTGCPTEIPGPPPPPGTGTRCVTSIGEVNGVKRRVQARLRSTLVPISTFQGLVGTGGITINNGGVINTAVGSNGLVTVNGSGKVGDIYSSCNPPATCVQKSPNATIGTIYPHDPFVLPKLDAEFADSLLAPPNTNSALPGTKTGTVTWNPTTRDLFIGKEATITLGSGTYNLCRLKMENNAKLYVASGATVKLFIDSKDRDPACATAAALGPTLDLASGAQFNNPGEPKNFQLYLYGKNDGTEKIKINHAVSFRGSIYAPQTALIFAAQLDVAGAVAARSLEFSAGVNFTWDAALKEIVTALKTYERRGWSECPREPTTAGDPESGC